MTDKAGRASNLAGDRMALRASRGRRWRRRQGQAVGLLVGTLIHGQERVGEALRGAILRALAAVAADDPGRLAVQEAGGVPLLIKLMDDGSPDAVQPPASPSGRGHTLRRETAPAASCWRPGARAGLHGEPVFDRRCALP